MNLATLANLAKAPATPQNVTIDTKSLTNSTTLFWQTPKSGKVKGYYVLFVRPISLSGKRKFLPLKMALIFLTQKTIISLPYKQ
jgi:hypothetical protein